MNSSASAPSRTTWIRFETLFFRSERRVNSASFGLSSTKRISTGFPVMGSPPQREIERRTFVDFRFCPGATAMPMNDALHDCEADSRSFVLLSAVEPLEYAEQLPRKLHVEANPIVLDKVDGAAPIRPALYFDRWLLSIAGELERVRE